MDELQAVHLRHVPIDEDDVGRGRGSQPIRAPRARCRASAVSKPSSLSMSASECGGSAASRQRSEHASRQSPRCDDRARRVGACRDSKRTAATRAKSQMGDSTGTSFATARPSPSAAGSPDQFVRHAADCDRRFDSRHLNRDDRAAAGRWPCEPIRWRLAASCWHLASCSERPGPRR